jgi:cyclopropane fatty-acyl-phospholipid synthase-like methyltransferase
MDSDAQRGLMEKKAWFEEWFDTPYYHILYSKRDDVEAAKFIDNLSFHLNMKKGQLVLDLACGKGRHSIYLNQKGFDVVGADLSEKNVDFANQFANETLHFKVHDMRKAIRENRYDFILNMFTSFGYFESHEENIQTLRSVYGGLKKGGEFLIDFLNCEKIINHLDEKEIKTIEGIRFEITKTFEDRFIIKNIHLEERGETRTFHEKVMAITLETFQKYFDLIGFEVLGIYGDYSLNPFDMEQSDRLILRVKKS